MELNSSLELSFPQIAWNDGTIGGNPIFKDLKALRAICVINSQGRDLPLKCNDYISENW